MRILSLILFFILFFQNFSIAKEKIFEDPIELKQDPACKLNEFCEKFIDNIDLEKFIKTEMENEYVPISLDECLNIALLNNFNIQITNHEFKSSKYEYQYALTKFLPTFLTTSYIAKYTGQILVGGVLSDDFNETAISVNLTAQHYLTKGGREIFEAKAAKYFSKSKKHTAEFTKTKTLYLTAKYYYEMVLAKVNIEIYLRNLIERNAQLSLAQNLKNTGFGTNFDVIRSKNESLDAKNKLLHSLNQFRMSQSRLANIMGIDNNTALMPIESEVKELNLINNIGIEEMFELAKSNREDLKSYWDLIAYEKQIKNSYYTDFIPKPLLSFQQQFQGTAKTSVYPNYVIAAYVNWEPGEYLGIGSIKKISEQKEKIKTRKLEYENKLRDIKQAIIDANSTTNFNKKQIEINKKRMEFTKESIKLAMLRFNHGKGILLDVIQAQSEFTAARIQYVSSIIDYNISQLELLFNTGTIEKEKIIENYKP